MRPFNEIKFNRRYDSNNNEHDILNDFYIPTLKHSTKYDRVASYFRSSAFLVNAPGLAQFLINGGKIRLIINVELDNKDYEAINNGSLDKNLFFEDYFSSEVDELEKQIKKNRFELLSWLISSNTLDIKVGYIENDIEHSKYGIFYDDYENKISFNGSINESIRGWTSQGNKIKVFTTWTDRKEDVHDDIEDFERLWSNQGSKTETIDFPQAVKDKIISIKSIDVNDMKAIDSLLKEIKEEDIKKEKSLTNKFDLWEYQKNAVEAWHKNNNVGLLEMATGTGKTFTAIHGLMDLQKKHEQLLTIIICHSKDLVRQWEKELKKFDLENFSTIGNSKWRGKISDKLNQMFLGIIDFPIIITTYNTYYKDDFIKPMEEKSDIKKLILCDEAHTASTSEFIKGLSNCYQYRLALTATPYGYFDDLGYASKMMKYFGCTQNEEGNFNPTFSYDLEDAIKGKMAPEPSLVPYHYELHKVSLSDDELEKYKRLTNSLSWNKNKNKKESEELLREQLIYKRAEIIKSAINKIPKLNDIMLKMDKIEYLLIYHSPEDQKEEVYQLLNRQNDIIWNEFTSNQSDHEREKLLIDISNKDINVLTAMKCLDQGVDVPAVRNAIILSSSGNPMTFIQRRGRVLRKFKGKKSAIIHDFIVLPPISNKQSGNLEKSIIKKELKRILEFSRLSLISTKVFNIIAEIANQYKIDLGKIDGKD
jgi:superfamily II DNA or RNA helicase